MEPEEEAGPGPDPEVSAAQAAASNDLNNNAAQPDKLAPPAAAAAELGKVTYNRSIYFLSDKTNKGPRSFGSTGSD